MTAEPTTLQALAQECILKQANSDIPSVILADVLLIAYELGVQTGIRQSTASLDEMASEHGA